jgi:hypothetical protein
VNKFSNLNDEESPNDSKDEKWEKEEELII